MRPHANWWQDPLGSPCRVPPTPWRTRLQSAARQPLAATSWRPSSTMERTSCSVGELPVGLRGSSRPPLAAACRLTRGLTLVVAASWRKALGAAMRPTGCVCRAHCVVLVPALPQSITPCRATASPFPLQRGAGAAAGVAALVGQDAPLLPDARARVCGRPAGSGGHLEDDAWAEAVH